MNPFGEGTPNTLGADRRQKAAQWSDCCRAAGRLADLVCLMYHPRDEKARKTWPTATWAEIIASELGIEIPESTTDLAACPYCKSDNTERLSKLRCRCNGCGADYHAPREDYT